MFNRSKPQPPGPGQESVWDYPRPPRAELSSKRVRVVFNGEVIADTARAVRILETSHPPVYYIPQADVRMDTLTRTNRQTVCEFKGAASYWTIRVGDRVAADVAWSYPKPLPGYDSIRDAIAFYPSRMDECTVDGERVQPQEGDFYGGWITSDIVGPFKGAPGTWGW